MIRLTPFATAGIIAGSIYDAVLASCAVKSGVDVLLTSKGHFLRLGSQIARLVKTPLEFLS